MKFRRKRSGGTQRGWGRTELSFPTVLDSADRGLHFEATCTYSWEPADTDTAPLLYGDAAARTLLRDAAAATAIGHPVLRPADAEAAINAELSDGIRTEPRLVVRGTVTLRVSDEVLTAAHRRVRLTEEQHEKEVVETARLEALRERLLDRGLGLAWWIDRFADVQYVAGDPAARTTSVIQAYRTLADALRAESIDVQADDKSVIRARVEELLAVLEDPTTGKRAANLLEEVIRTLAPEANTAMAADRRQSARTAE